MVYSYTIMDSPKMLRETLAFAQTAIDHFLTDRPRQTEHVLRLQRLINECDRMRPIDSAGKHGDRHTKECGCQITTFQLSCGHLFFNGLNPTVSVGEMIDCPGHGKVEIVSKIGDE